MSPMDQLLLDRWTQTRDADAFKQLAARYAGLVYGTCRRVLRNTSDAEEVAQECFMVLAGAKQHRVTYLSAWLHRVALNRSITRLHADRTRKDREEAYAREHEQSVEPTWNDIEPFIDEAIGALPESLREPIVAHFLEDQTHDAIAQDLGISRQTVTYRIGKGIEQIRDHLKRRGVPIAVAALAVTVKANAAEAAPTALTSMLGKLALAGSMTSAPLATGTNFVGVVTKAWAMIPAKVAALAAGLAIVAAAAYFGALGQSKDPDTEDTAVAQVTQAASSAAAPSAVASVSKEGVTASSKAASMTASTAQDTSTHVLAGVIVDADDQPVSGAFVTLTHGQDGTVSSQARTSTDGRFSVEYDPRRSAMLCVSAPQFLTFVEPCPVIEDGQLSATI